jgi:hypothetical protein
VAGVDIDVPSFHDKSNNRVMRMAF